MSYNKKIVSPSIAVKIIIFLAYCKKCSLIKTKEPVSFMQNLVFVSKEEGTEKLIFLSAADNINSAKKFSLQNRG